MLLTTANVVGVTVESIRPLGLTMVMVSSAMRRRAQRQHRHEETKYSRIPMSL